MRYPKERAVHSKQPCAAVLAAALFLTQSCSSPAHSPESHVVFLNDYEGARASAMADGRTLLVNSTSHNAANARVMEVKIFKDPLVAEALQGFVEARIYADANDPDARAANQVVLDRVVQEAVVPVYVAVHPETGEELGRWSGASFEPTDFAEFLGSVSGQSR